MVGLQQKVLTNRALTWLIIIEVVLGAALLGTHPSIYWLVLAVVAIGSTILIKQPLLGLLALAPAALLVPLEIGTGTAVALNLATLLVPALLGVWLGDMLRRSDVRLVPSRLNRPLLLFLLAGLLSLVIGNAFWDPAVFWSDNFVIVQLAQWAIFAFSAGALWLTGNLVRNELWLQRLTFSYLVIAGGLGIARVVKPTTVLMYHYNMAGVVDRATFWLLLAAVAGGQLLFNQRLTRFWRLFLMASVVAAVIYAFFKERVTASNWIGVGAVIGVLVWLRFPRFRWPVIALLVVLLVSGLLTSAIYDFAGGDAEWEESGGSRLTLIGRVIEVTMRNPITGLGPAAYRDYARMKPLLYGGAFYLDPWVNSHNNYVDLFSQMGLLGLSLFLWFALEVALLGLRMRSRFSQGFAAGYVNAMLATWAGALVVMLFADWIMPFVYNIGFHGFQNSVLVWLFLGGLVALEQMAKNQVVQ